MYGRYLLALLLPGSAVPTFPVGPVVPKALIRWSPEELALAIEEGRRQLDRQGRDHERIQTRSQFLFTSSVALLVVLAAATRRIAEAGGITLFVVWGVGMLVVLAAILGAASLLSVRAEFKIIDARLVSYQAPGDVQSAIATAYTTAVGLGEATVATRLTVYRDAVLLLLIGSAIDVFIWVVTAGR